MNPYEKCTSDKMINVKQFKIQWYVDENKVAHVSEDVITGFSNIIKKYFEELVVSHKNKHTFLDMYI